MCGIAGIIGRADPAARPAVERMQAALRHRGPDGHGLWTSAANNAILAHTRLAVIDPTPAGHQPMSTPDGRFTISFCGEVYNHRALRRDLERRGVAFVTRSDTEVILAGYQVHGRPFIEQLRGMFALALWDEGERSCLLARDPFGLKPLYVHHAADGALMFASELRALIASGEVPRDLDPHGVHGYLRTGTVPEPRTLLSSVSTLNAGHTLEWKQGIVNRRAFWSMRFAGERNGNHHSDAVRAALVDSVRHHLVSDVPVGVFLSGGVDSASMLALAREAGHTGIRTFTMALPGSRDDESDPARRTAAHFGARHAECRVDAASARDLFPSYLAAIDQPSIDGFNTFTVATFARQHGVKVALSGVGADELFGGYASFTQVPKIASWNERLSWSGPLRPIGGRVLEGLATAPRWRRVGDLLQQAPTIANTYTTYRAIFTRREARRIAESFGITASDDEPVDAGEAPTAADTVSHLELTRYVRNQLARDSDAASMACGLELRAPFLDATLFAAVAGIPAGVRLSQDKRLLRDAVPELPEWVGGPKRCFQLPFDDWAEREWRPIFADAEAACPVPAGTWYRKLCVLVLKHWIERLNANGG